MVADADSVAHHAGTELAVDPDVRKARERLAAALNRMVNAMAARDDLLLRCVWNTVPVAGRPDAPAWFVPTDLTVTLNAQVGLQGVDPATVNPLTATGRRRCPVLIGALAHESGHAHSTLWPDGFGPTVSPAVARAAALLEEPRVEGRQVARRPQDRPFLRASASVLLGLDTFVTGGSTPADRWAAAAAAALILGRCDAGVLEPEDVTAVVPVLRDLLGEHDLAKLAGIWAAALELADGDVAGLVDLAARWVAIVGEPPEAEMPLTGCRIGPAADPAEHPPGDDTADADRSAGGDPIESAPLVAALDAALSTALAGARASLAPPMPGRGADDTDDTDAEDEEVRRAARQAAVVFGAGAAAAARAVGLETPRAPTDDERTLARAMGAALRRARFRERTVTTRMAAVPPGRLNGREAMLGAAQRARGAAVTARPFRSTVHRRVPEPPVTLGIAIDVSGSMQWAETIMATVAWASAHAVTAVHGRSASVVFGEKVAALAHPGSPPSMVTPFRADAASENFSAAFAALDGALDLTRGQGVRMLVVVSDGVFVEEGQPAAAAEAVTRMRRSGGHVLWIPGDAQMPPGATGVNVDLVPAPSPAGMSGRAVERFRDEDTARRLARIPEAITAALTEALRG